MLIAGVISKGAREILQQEGVGYFDPSGSLFIPASGAYVLFDRPPPKKMDSAFGCPFMGNGSASARQSWKRRLIGSA